jgi:hypothetical protein
VREPQPHLAILKAIGAGAHTEDLRHLGPNVLMRKPEAGHFLELRTAYSRFLTLQFSAAWLV